MKRGLRVRLATDARALRYSGLFSRDTIDVVPSAANFLLLRFPQPLLRCLTWAGSSTARRRM